MENVTIGITGGIGAGKSIVSRILRCNGHFVYDCDARAKRLMIENKSLKKKIVESLGENTYLPSGELNKKLISSLIFSDKSKRLLLNSLVHKAVEKDILSIRVTVKGYFFIESAILASSGIEKICDEIWIITAPESLRFVRVSKRDGLSEEEIRLRLNSQENEIQNINHPVRVEIINDNRNPMLEMVLKLIDNYKLNQTYLELC